MRAPRLFICRDKNTQGCLPGRLRIFIGQKPTLNERGEWCNYSASPEDFKVVIPREMYPDIKDGGYMTYDKAVQRIERERQQLTLF